MNKNDETWFEEGLTDNVKRSYRVKNVLCHHKSNFQEINIFDLVDQGVSLILDGQARVFEIDEFIYHEGFVHASLARIDKPNSILVLGDGDGGLIRELLKYPDIKNIDWVEIDPMVVKCCEKFLPSFPTRYQTDGRVTLFHEDGSEYLRQTRCTYDLIFVSVSVDPRCSFASSFLRADIYQSLKRVLNDGGMIAHSLEEFSPVSVYAYLRRVENVRANFQYIKPFSIPLPSFGSSWGFVLACDAAIPTPKDNSPPSLRYFDLEEDDRMFRLPNYLVSGLSI